MRLLLLTPEYDGAGGGIMTFYRALAPALRARGRSCALSREAPFTLPWIQLHGCMKECV